MRKYGRATTLLFLFLFILPGLFGEAIFPEADFLERFPGLTRADLEVLKSEGELTRYIYEGDTLRFFPILPEQMRASILSDIDEIEPTVGVESLFLMETPGLTASNLNGAGSTAMLEIYNTLRRISTLEGVQYYSASRQRMRTFFKEAYVIADESSRERLPDPLVDQIPGDATVFIHQRDLTFGKNISEGVYRYSGRVINLSLTNLQIMRYALIPFIQPRDMQTHMIILPMEGYIGFYGYCGVETISFLGIEKSKSDSFYNRMKALFSWFQENLPVL